MSNIATRRAAVPFPLPRNQTALVAHRGDSAHHVENTAAALACGAHVAEAVEFDVRFTHDCVPFVWHDTSLARLLPLAAAAAAAAVNVNESPQLSVMCSCAAADGQSVANRSLLDVYSAPLSALRFDDARFQCVRARHGLVSLREALDGPVADANVIVELKPFHSDGEQSVPVRAMRTRHREREWRRRCLRNFVDVLQQCVPHDDRLMVSSFCEDLLARLHACGASASTRHRWRLRTILNVCVDREPLDRLTARRIAMRAVACGCIGVALCSEQFVQARRLGVDLRAARAFVDELRTASLLVGVYVVDDCAMRDHIVRGLRVDWIYCDDAAAMRACNRNDRARRHQRRQRRRR